MKTVTLYRQTEDLENPKVRWIAGHYITAKQLKEVQAQ